MTTPQIVTMPSDELARLLGDTLAYLGANNDQIRVMALSWSSEIPTTDPDHFAYVVRMQAAGLSPTRRAQLAT